MARRPRRSAKRPTPRPARRPSAKLCLHSAMERVRASFAEAAPRLRTRIEAGHELWQSLIGEPMPLDLDDMQSAAVRFGLPADVVHRGDFTLAEVTNFMVGKRVAALDELYDRVRATEAEVTVRRAAGNVTPSMSTPAGEQAEAVDDEYAGIARRLSDNARSMLRYLLVVTALDRASCFDLNGIASDLELSRDAVRSARREVGSIKPPLLESARGRGNGVWLSPAGRLVAERIPPSTCRQACLAEISTKKHKTGAA